jgi:hypothetical protein
MGLYIFMDSLGFFFGGYSEFFFDFLKLFH